MSTLATVLRSTVAAAALGIAGLGLAGTAAAAPVTHLNDQITHIAAENPAPDLNAEACDAAKTPGTDCADVAQPTHKTSKGR